MNDNNNKKETPADLKEQARESDPKKGYNEQNPVQPAGAFVPDSEDDTTPDTAPHNSGDAGEDIDKKHSEI